MDLIILDLNNVFKVLTVHEKIVIHRKLYDTLQFLHSDIVQNITQITLNHCSTHHATITSIINQNLQKQIPIHTQNLTQCLREYDYFLDKDCTFHQAEAIAYAVINKPYANTPKQKTQTDICLEVS